MGREMKEDEQKRIDLFKQANSERNEIWNDLLSLFVI